MFKRFIPHFLIVFILGFAYSQTIAPSLSWANDSVDGGDLITAAAVNGVAHPTGYPLYLLIAKFFQVAIPCGDLAFRTNLLSVICSIAAALLVYQTIVHVLFNQQHASLAGIVAALSFGLAPLIWSQAVITEVYALQSLLTIAVVYQTIMMGNRSQDNLMRGLLMGLALGNHITSVFLLPLLLMDGKRFRVCSVSELIPRALGLMAGSAVYVILPIRAPLQPPVNWFNPVDMDGMWHLVSGKLFQSYFSNEFFHERARGVAGSLITNFTILGVTAGLYAAIDSKKYFYFNVILLWIFFVHILFSLVYASYDAHVYLIPSMLAFSLWVGIGFGEIYLWFAEKWIRTRWMVMAGLALFFGLRLFFTIPKVDASRDTRAEGFLNTVLEAAPQDAIIFTNGDKATFSLWYAHFALKLREDIAVVDEGLLPFAWYRHNLRENYPVLTIPDQSTYAAYYIITQNPERPFCSIRYEEKIIMRCSQDHSKVFYNPR